VYVIGIEPDKPVELKVLPETPWPDQVPPAVPVISGVRDILCPGQTPVGGVHVAVGPGPIIKYWVRNIC